LLAKSPSAIFPPPNKVENEVMLNFADMKARNDKIVEMVKAGHTDKEIRNTLKVTKNVVCGVRYKHNLFVAKNRPKGAKFTEERKEQLKALVKSGKIKARIMEEMEITRHQLDGWLKKLDLHVAASNDVLSLQAYAPIIEIGEVKRIEAEKTKAELTIATEVQYLDPFLTFTAKNQCQFIKNSVRPYLFCTSIKLEGKSYCLDHCKICYQQNNNKIVAKESA
jgi:DNA-binding CsgD family transcriptional regulator